MFGPITRSNIHPPTPMKPTNRRQFLKTSIGMAAAATALSQTRVLGANNRVVLGMMGLGGRGSFLASSFAKRDDVEIAYLCDVNVRRLDAMRPVVEAAQPHRPKLVQDFRRMLEDPAVDAVVNATPDHWHALGTIMACQAGKDVYVEKPMSHNLWEGRKMLEAARKYQRVVQVGMQTRSAPYVQSALEFIRGDHLGDIHLVRVFNMMRHSRQRHVPDGPVPEGLDYDMWTGPAPLLPYNPGRVWLNQWEYSCGPIPGDAIHQLDLARMIIGDRPFPDTVCNTGGVIALKDGRKTPDTQLAAYEYGELSLMLDAALWTPYMKKTPVSVRDSDQFPNWPFSSTKIEVFGTDGFIYLGRHGGGWQAFNPDGEIVRSEYGRQADAEHQDNFIQCIRDRRRPNADVEQGHYSAALCHLANTSFRAGNRKLRFNAATETFPETPDADAFLRRKYRAPWIVPDQV